MNIRLEQAKDEREVENLTREAFWNVYRPGCTEHYVLNQYRTNPDFIPELDFVMEEDSRIIGHVMFSKAEITLDDGTVFPSWTFGPVSIHPDYKRKGYGLKLLQYAIEKAKEMGIGLLQMEGNIEFYKHAGFDLASKMKIHYHAEPRDAEVPYFLAQELIPGYWGHREGTYCPPKGYFVADENPEAFEAYEATFPKKEKAFQEGQLPQFCQSCGMPLTRIEDCGSEADGSTNFDYCKYCYKDGHFLQDCTMDEMIEHCAQFVDEVNKNMTKPMTKEEYKQMMRGFFPMLKRWKQFIVMAFLSAITLPLLAQTDWKLIWSEEFNTDGAFNPEVWEPERGFVRNHEDQWYQGENAYQQDGCLVIEARKEEGIANPMYRPEGRRDWRRERKDIAYTSASLTTRRSFEFLYGRLEVRAKIPTGGGSWPAIWLLGKGMPWPSCGEIDVMEYYRINGVPHILANAAWGNDRPNTAVWNSKKIPFSHFTDQDADWASKFHLWRMDWTPEAIRIYLDGELLNDIPLTQTVNGTLGQHQNPFTRPQYLLLNLAIGGDNGGRIDETAFPMKYEIDYVRVYQEEKQ